MQEKRVEDLSSQPAKLVDWADYQTESIVSRKLIQKPTGSVTFFAFDQGQELSEHTAPYDALVYIIDGEAQIVISGRPTLVRQGEIFMMPANHPHALKATKKFKMLLTMVRSKS
jgi:quercetin dioxygenase-like cupin family protein